LRRALSARRTLFHHRNVTRDDALCEQGGLNIRGLGTAGISFFRLFWPLQCLAQIKLVNHIIGMAYAGAGFRLDDKDDALQRSFWRKLRRVAAQIPFAENLLAAYYCAFDRNTPLQVKATLVAAIAYFVLPIDAIPDVLPVIGFTDDAAVLAIAINLVSSHIKPVHRETAKNKLANL
jgi:uncharacterized membrane protein YkvA (DUF1232 family)